MNSEQRVFLRMGCLILFLIVLYTLIRMLIPTVEWFILSIILCGCLFMNFYFDVIVITPLTEHIGFLKGKVCMLRVIKNGRKKQL